MEKEKSETEKQLLRSLGFCAKVMKKWWMLFGTSFEGNAEQQACAQ